MNLSGIGDGEWGNGMLVIGRDGAIVGAVLMVAAADEEGLAIVVVPNPGIP